MKQLLCLSDAPWTAVPNRTQQLMARLRSAQILFFGPPARRGDNSFRQPGRRVRPNIIAYTLPHILGAEERHTLLFQRDQKRLGRFIERAMSRHRFREPLLWCTTPSYVHLLDLIPHRGLVYDCARDWSCLPIRWESELTLEADVAFAASPELADHLSPCNENVAILPNGVNYSMFCQQSLPSNEIQSLRRGRPILGYAGPLWRDLDLRPLIAAAQAMPEAGFVLAGAREDCPLDRLPPNVYCLEPGAAADLPQSLSYFDVCLSFLRRRHSNDIIPGHIYEYLSAGKPIVCMYERDQVECFPDVIYGAYSTKEFAQLCRRALAETGDWARKRRQAYGEAASWPRRAQEVERILEGIGLYD
ncbi:hypothetical protein [Pseudoflavonifractor sp. 524-17]|uniref:glycosyltransferase family protein n=1 Tax=Pseudoflavonifractor sp. 524-17 TaxID=2304577 RepID=UPI001FADB2ED|nr:hypothetical protein [Pseudoflavonifractor sp. 524-17]